MLHRSTQLALALSLSFLATGCKVALTVTSGGDVTSLSGANDCAGGSLCEYEVTDTNFSETFTAVPRAGYVFSKWQGGAGYLCAESTNPTCTISNAPLEGLPEAQRDVADTVIASGVYYYAQPLFTFVGIDTDADGTKDYLDPDDDNDGVLDADDNCPLEGPNLDGFGCPVEPPGSVNCATIVPGNNFADDMLCAHNARRGTFPTPTPVPALNDLQWDPALADIAADWAAQCTFANNPSRSQIYGGYVGENIFAALPQISLVELAITTWVESRMDNYDYASNTCLTSDCALYTQVVWRDTQKLGCAVQRCPEFGGTLLDFDLLVCNYSPGGNLPGQRPY